MSPWEGPAEIFWSFEPDGSIVVKTETRPTAAALWQAINPNAPTVRSPS
jgi:hypothetical protein